MQDALSKSHPLVSFVYFTSVIVFAIVFWHPVFIAVSLVAAFSYALLRNPRKATAMFFKFLFPVFIISTVLNALISHYGITMLFMLPNKSPVTLEAVVMGAVIGALLALVILWFSCINEVVTTDKALYLFAKVIPTIALVISMTLRLVPRFKGQLKAISDAQDGIGKGIKTGKLNERIKNAALILSILITWAFENSVETAESMKSRGYGQKNRTFFEDYYISARDVVILIFILVCDALIIFGAITGETSVTYVPTIIINQITFKSTVIYLVYSALCMLPVIFNITEGVRWRVIRSKI